MKRGYSLSDIREFLCYKIENGQESDHEYALYLSIIENKINIKEEYKSLLKSLVKEIKEYEES
jgi:hypothetical protein